VPTDPTAIRDQHELLHLGEIFTALAQIVALDRRGTFEICELGCTTGWLAQELTAIGRVTGVDPDAERIAQARARYANVQFETADLLSWMPQREFDLVVSNEVIEHLSEKRRYLDTIRRLVKPGGWVLLTTPNKKLKPYWDAADMGEGLFEDWLTMRELRALFANFDIVQHRTFLFDFAYTGVYRWLNAKKLRALLVACGVAPLYDALRQSMGDGLYQLLVCKKRD
jgi:SAM-dependent methyltransferase